VGNVRFPSPVAELGIPALPFTTADSVKYSFMSRMGISAAECLRENCPVPNNVIVKDFARWYYKSRRGRLGERPNDISVRNTVKKFFSGFERIIKIKNLDGLRVDVYTVSFTLKCWTGGQPC
jgi:hypothetical protein